MRGPWVGIRPEYKVAWVGCQPESLRRTCGAVPERLVDDVPVRLSGSSIRPQIVKRIGSRVCWIFGGLMILLLFLGVFVSVGFEVDRARPAAARAQIAAFLEALGACRSDAGGFPTEAQGLRALRANPGVRGWNGPYMLREIPADPWGVPYRYRVVRGLPQVVSLAGGSPRGERAIASDGEFRE